MEHLLNELVSFIKKQSLPKLCTDTQTCQMSTKSLYSTYHFQVVVAADKVQRVGVHAYHLQGLEDQDLVVPASVK